MAASPRGDLRTASAARRCRGSASLRLDPIGSTRAAEVGPLGIRVLVVEPGAFRTSFSGGGLHESASLPAYDDTVGPTRHMIKSVDGTQPGDPARAAAAILRALDAADAPLRLPLGDDAVDGVLDHLQLVGEQVRAWEQLSRSTAFPAPALSGT